MIKFKKRQIEKAIEKRKSIDPKISKNQVAYAVLTSDIPKESKRRMFYNYLFNEEMPMDVLERVGEYLDVAPESLTGETSVLLDDDLLPYSFHLYQTLTMKRVMRDWMVFTGNGNVELTQEKWNELYNGLKDFTDQFLSANNKK